MVPNFGTQNSSNKSPPNCVEIFQKKNLKMTSFIINKLQKQEVKFGTKLFLWNTEITEVCDLFVICRKEKIEKKKKLINTKRAI